jgi:hypothetical protein
MSISKCQEVKVQERKRKRNVKMERRVRKERNIELTK